MSGGRMPGGRKPGGRKPGATRDDQEEVAALVRVANHQQHEIQYESWNASRGKSVKLRCPWKACLTKKTHRWTSR